jgi:hypothetical protein
MDHIELLKIKDLVKSYPFLNEDAVRRFIKKNTHDIKNTIIKIGGTIYFDVNAFDKWIDSQRLVMRKA